MMMLATFDSFFILLVFLNLSLPSMAPQYEKSAFYNYMIPILLPLNQIAMTGSIYSKVAITIERYLIVCHPFYVMSHRWKAKLYILPIITFSVVYNLPKFFEIQTTVTGSTSKLVDEGDNTTMNELQDNKESNNSTMEEEYTYGIKPTLLRQNFDYILMYMIWTNFVLMGVIPFTLLIALSALTLKGLKEHLSQQSEVYGMVQLGTASSRVKRDSSEVGMDTATNQTNGRAGSYCSSVYSENRNNEMCLAKISMWIIVIFIVCHSIRWIPNIYELIQHTRLTDEFQWPSWIESITHLSHFSTTFNASINFYIYYIVRLKKNQLKRVYKSSVSKIRVNMTSLHN